jgi:hypothetical protein
LVKNEHVNGYWRFSRKVGETGRYYWKREWIQPYTRKARPKKGVKLNHKARAEGSV